MVNAIRTLGTIFCLLLLLIAPAVAQRLQSGATPAAAGPTVDLSVGYSYVDEDIPTARHVSPHGVDLAGEVGLTPRWGATIDANYAFNSKMLGTPHGGYMFTFQVGPVFDLFDRGKNRIFLEGLVGAGIVDGAVPINSKLYTWGWVTRPAYAAGAGFQRTISGPFAVGVKGDYLRTSFLNSAGGTQGQNNFRATVSLILHLSDRQHGITH